MTNDFSVEQKRPSAAPYGIVGLAAGAGLGTQLPKWTSKPMSYEQIVEEVNDKDKFEKRLAEDAEHATEWKDVQAQAEKVKAAEKAVEEASKPQLAENSPARKAYEQALAEQEAELKRLADRKRAELVKDGGSAITIDGFDPKKLDTFENLVLDEYPKEYVKDYGRGKKAGTEIKTSDMKKLYEDLVRESREAHANLDKSLDAAGGLRTKRNAQMADIKALFDGYEGDLVGKNEDFITNFFNETRTAGATGWEDSAQFAKARAIAKSAYPDVDVSKWGEEEWTSIGRILEKGEKASVGKSTKVISVKNEKGHRVSRTVEYDMDSYFNFLKEKQEEVLTKRQSATEQIFSNAQEYHNLLKDKANLNETIANEFTGSQWAEAGNVLKTSGGVDSLDMAKIISEKGHYKSDRAKLNEMIHSGKPLDETIIGRYIDVAKKGNPTKAEAEKALKAVEMRGQIAAKYRTELRNIEQQIKDCTSNNSIVEELTEKVNKAIETNEAVAKADGALREQFPNLRKLQGKVTAGAGLSESEIASQAEKYANEHLGQTFKDKVASTKKVMDEAIAKDGGKIDEALKSAKEKLVTEEKEKLTKMGEELSGKIGKVPGMKKGVGMAIGAVALGLVGLGIGKAVNKNKNA